ncbi:MAG: hypothetical protein JW769_04705 [Parachlamydiales bacterium]|nr:hypothetical protein [Parachlamydiales bacterium]
MIEIYFKTIRDEQFQQISDYRVGSWIHVDQATIADLGKIKDLTGLDIADLQDSLDLYEIPRIEHKEENIIIFVRHPAPLERGLHTSTLAIILTGTYIITISPTKSSLVDTIVDSRTPLATTQKSKLLLYIILKITQDFTAKIKVVRNSVIGQERQMKNITNKTIVVLTKNEEILNQYYSSLVPMHHLLESITSGRYVSLYEKDHDLLQDLLIAVKQSEDICQVNIKSIRSLRDAYQILFTNDVNKTIKLLTAITIIFTIPTIISSFYGMNVALPFAKNSYAFSIIMAMTILICIASVIIFARKKWL